MVHLGRLPADLRDHCLRLGHPLHHLPMEEHWPCLVHHPVRLDGPMVVVHPHRSCHRRVLDRLQADPPCRGIPLNAARTKFLNPKLIPAIFMVLGAMFKYLWIAALPQYYYNDYIGHIDLNTGALNRHWDYNNRAYPRWDDWFLATGLLVFVELSPGLQKFFSSKVFTYFGRLGFSIAMVAGTVMLSVGSMFYHYLVETHGWTSLLRSPLLSSSPWYPSPYCAVTSGRESSMTLRLLSQGHLPLLPHLSGSCCLVLYIHCTIDTPRSHSSRLLR